MTTAQQELEAERAAAVALAERVAALAERTGSEAWHRVAVAAREEASRLDATTIIAALHASGEHAVAYAVAQHPWQAIAARPNLVRDLCALAHL